MYMAKLLLKTSLITRDKVPMANNFYFEALDKTQRDILHSRSAEISKKPFSGMTIVLGGHFR